MASSPPAPTRSIGTDSTRIDRILRDIVRPSDYVGWEYVSRQRLLATSVAAFRGSVRSRILDIGCGNGALSLTLGETAGFDLVAMDILPERLSTAIDRRRTRGSSPAVAFLLADADKGLPFRDESFDAAIATEVLEHLDDPGRMVRDVHRVLRRGGHFFMTTPNLAALPYRILRHLPDAAVKALAASLTPEHLHPTLCHDSDHPANPSHPDQHRREGFTLRELQGLGAACGLRMVRGYTYRIPLPDRVMLTIPRRASAAVARLGTRPWPAGLQLFAEFAKG